MKFAHQLTFNTHPDWRDDYIDYDKLKRLIYTIERVVCAYASQQPEIRPSKLRLCRTSTLASVDTKS